METSCKPAEPRDGTHAHGAGQASSVLSHPVKMPAHTVIRKPKQRPHLAASDMVACHVSAAKAVAQRRVHAQTQAHSSSHQPTVKDLVTRQDGTHAHGAGQASSVLSHPVKMPAHTVMRKPKQRPHLVASDMVACHVSAAKGVAQHRVHAQTQAHSTSHQPTVKHPVRRRLNTALGSGEEGMQPSKRMKQDVLHAQLKCEEPIPRSLNTVAEMRTWAAAQRDAVGANNNFDWSKASQEISACKTFHELYPILVRLKASIPPLRPQYTPGGRAIDQLDMKTMALLRGKQKRYYFAASTLPDGNCAVRSISRIMFGTQHRYQEIRVRMAIEAGINENSYIKDAHLTPGYASCPKIKSLLCHYTYDSRSWHDSKPDKLDFLGYRQIFRAELLLWSKDEAYLGVWPFHVASTVCRQPIRIAHPMPKDRNSIWNMYNRIIYPLHMQPDEIGGEESYIRITFTTANANKELATLQYQDINHFVPLMVPTPPMLATITSLDRTAT